MVTTIVITAAITFFITLFTIAIPRHNEDFEIRVTKEVEERLRDFKKYKDLLKRLKEEDTRNIYFFDENTCKIIPLPIKGNIFIEKSYNDKFNLAHPNIFIDYEDAVDKRNQILLKQMEE